MAIGDDDQTIYEWRGADPSLILSFARRYGAARYLIRDNFRSHAAPLALANRVIARNVKREPKRLSLTRGFAGTVQAHEEDSPERQGRHVAELVGEALAIGASAFDEIAILVRLVCPDPLFGARAAGSGLALPGRRQQPVLCPPGSRHPAGLSAAGGGREDGPGEQVRPQFWGSRRGRIRRRGRSKQGPYGASYSGSPRIGGGEGPCPGSASPTNRPVTCPASPARASRRPSGAGRPWTQALRDAAAQAQDHLASRLLDLADTLTWLAGALDTLPAGAALTLLDHKIGYLDYLRRSSGFPETGAARAANVEAFLRYAQAFTTPRDLLAHLDDLAARGIGRNRDGAADGIALLTVFRAKGLQWPVVFVPDCNQGIFPYGGPDELEEERRLFYVALTRTQSQLHLHTVKTEPPSQFLAEADCRATLDAVRQVGTLIGRNPATWTTAEALTLLRHTPALGLERYFQTWWDAPTEHARAVAARLLSLCASANRQSLSGPLGLSDAHQAPWRTFGPWPAPDTDAFPDLADHAPKPAALSSPASTAFRPGALHIGSPVHHPQHGLGTVLAIRGDRLSPRLEIQFARGKPVVLPAKFVQMGAGQ